ncbi:hypothetical protein C3B44_07085 [Corynebacterium yudongzhengii]|uniref:DUF1003 domain-containing protein n=1 Tax=Corynebacterium yudongzhengii TaxID=2080740 RepID=A0A2U1T9N6_9CORY|nr:DUF1003 domain-containing protein [Corynebacterium yudongzhengii]AWB82151.1 hypothetical protein C3B44_07085 [Corynebacterium yudongzhengii]PWC02655.1 DUF1003 domain-containing protein [Corynebacterium yudongzhengii]
MAEPTRSDLTTPVGTRRRRLFRIDDESIGEAAETVARFFGTGRYLMWQTVVVVVWIALNLGGFWWNWDPYPFILLNLAFSTQAAYAAPLILLAQNRQEDRDKVTLAADRRRDELTKADTEFLARELARVRLNLGDTVTRDYLRRELDDMRSLMGRIEAKLDDATADDYQAPEDLHEPIQGDLSDKQAKR